MQGQFSYVSMCNSLKLKKRLDAYDKTRVLPGKRQMELQVRAT